MKQEVLVVLNRNPCLAKGQGIQPLSSVIRYEELGTESGSFQIHLPRRDVL